MNRLLEPFFASPAPFLKAFCKWFIDTIYFIGTVEIFSRIQKVAAVHDTPMGIEYIWIYIGFTLAYFFLKYLVHQWDWFGIVRSVVRFSDKKYFDIFIQSDGNLTERIGTSRLLTILESWEKTLVDLHFNIFKTVLPYTLFIVYGFIKVALISPYFIAGFALVLTISVILSHFVNTRWIQPGRHERYAINIENVRIRARVFASKNEYLQNNKLDDDIREIYKNLDLMQEKQRPVDTWITTLLNIPKFISFCMRLGLYLWVFLYALPSSELAGYIVLITVMESCMNSVSDSYRIISKDFNIIEKLWSTFDSLTPIRGYSEWSTFLTQPQDIIIDDLSYGYSEKKVFQNLSLTISHGKKTALVWSSGGWKTTLMKLIAGYLHPESGTLSVLWNQLDKTALKTYYPHIGYLTQDPGVFDATIRENLMSAVSGGEGLEKMEEAEKVEKMKQAGKVWGLEMIENIEGVEGMKEETEKKQIQTDDTMKINSVSVVPSPPPDKGELEGVIQNKKLWGTENKIAENNTITPPNLPLSGEKPNPETAETLDHRLISALRLAHCDFVFDLEKWLDTEIGERGVRLSGWQKQRLAIAKIFLKNPEIILLDEPTSALDSFSEEAITEALDTLFKERTVIIVAHRLQTVKKADDIIVLEQGTILERWTHDSLVQHGWRYARMLELQSGF